MMAQNPKQTQLHSIRAFLHPVMSSITRQALNRIEAHVVNHDTVVPNANLLFLQIVRSAIDMRSLQQLRIRQGLVNLLNVLQLKPESIIGSLKNPSVLYKYGIMRVQDQPAHAVSVLTNFVKSLDHPAGRLPTQGIPEQEELIKTRKPVISEYEKRRLVEKQKRMIAEMEAKRAARMKLVGPRGNSAQTRACPECGQKVTSSGFCSSCGKKTAKTPERYLS